MCGVKNPKFKSPTDSYRMKYSTPIKRLFGFPFDELTLLSAVVMLRCVIFLICGNYCKYRADQLCLQMKTSESLIYKTAKTVQMHKS